MKNEVLSVVGWVTAVQGALGAGGQIWGEGPWGLLHKLWDLSVPAYVVIMVVGLAIALPTEVVRKRGKL
ncbi:hypothetical protein [Streptomyces sp. NPDC048057]|uniref:hypothetical protein n=1 Tax=Streptomyces sp. NPDC048057 TaxID=3155628 RepID=UPI0033C10CE2